MLNDDGKYVIDEQRTWLTLLLSNALAKYWAPWEPISFLERLRIVSVYGLHDDEYVIDQ
jgi:hypothetical protein